MSSQLQSIDINHLISKSSSQTPRTTQSSAAFPNVKAQFSIFIQNGIVNILFSNLKDQQATLWILAAVEANNFYLTQVKDKKQRQFQLSILNQFLSVNKRRAQAEDFTQFCKQLNLLSHLLTVDGSFILYQKSDASATPAPEDIQNTLKEQVSQLFQITHIDRYKVLEKNADKLLQTFIKRAQLLSEELLQYSNAQQEASQKSQEKLDQLLKYTQSLLQNKYQKILITNSTLINVKLNTAYYCTITQDSLEFNEKNTVMKNEALVKFKENTATFNGQPFTEKTYTWLSEKFNSIGTDLKNNRAELYKNAK